jgi:hypothetical protein
VNTTAEGSSITVTGLSTLGRQVVAAFRGPPWPLFKPSHTFTIIVPNAGSVIKMITAHRDPDSLVGISKERFVIYRSLLITAIRLKPIRLAYFRRTGFTAIHVAFIESVKRPCFVPPHIPGSAAV